MYYSLNNKLFENSEHHISVNNRSFRYGDGFFETIKLLNNSVQLKPLHFYRIEKSIQLLKFDLPKYFSFDALEQQIIAVAKKNGHSKSARIRLTFFRNDEGLFEVKNHTPNILIQSFGLDSTKQLLNQNGLVLDVYPLAQKSVDVFSNIKSNNYLQYAMAAIWAKENRLNDALLLNTNNTIADSCIANVFIISKEILYTPTLHDGCVDGVMRRFVIDTCKKNDISVVEKSLTVADIEMADEMFLTNAIKGITWVQQCRKKTYQNQQVQKIANIIFSN